MTIDMSKDKFREVLRTLLRKAELAGKPYLDVLSADLHTEVGGYPALPGETHRMPQCCDVMHEMRRAEDDVVSAPASGKSTTLLIRYKLPRRQP
jgi:hypothetical protein